MQFDVFVTDQHKHLFTVSAASPEEAADIAETLFSQAVEQNTLPYTDHDFWVDDEDVSART